MPSTGPLSIVSTSTVRSTDVEGGIGDRKETRDSRPDFADFRSLDKFLTNL
jgi:hypothetical protein